MKIRPLSAQQLAIFIGGGESEIMTYWPKTPSVRGAWGQGIFFSVCSVFFRVFGGYDFSRNHGKHRKHGMFSHRIDFSYSLTVLFLVCSHAAFGQGEADELKVDSSIVVLNASIKDTNGRHVSGLNKQQFKVFEDGNEQQIEYFSAEQTPFAAVILLDTSGSMEQRVSMARAAAIRFLDGLRADDNAAIYRFDSKVELIQPFSNSRDIADRVFELKAYGMTRMNDAIYDAAVELSKRPEKRRAIVLLSDGQDTMSGRSADKALKAAMAADIAIYTIDMSSIGDSKRIQNQAPLKNFAEKSGGTFVSTPGGAAMREAFEKIVEDLGVQYTIGYAPANTKQDGKWRALELRVAKPNLTIRTRKGYTAGKAK